MSIRVNLQEIPGTVIEAKRWWRNQIRSTLKATTAEYRAEASAAITLAVLSLIEELEASASAEGKKINSVMAYSSVGREVETKALIEALWKAGKKVSLPICTNLGEDGKRLGAVGEMEARLVTGFDDLEVGSYNIPEPSDNTPVVDPKDIDLIILPCLGCDTSCGRIGHGAGYYDRFLEEIREDCYTVALCYDAILAEVPLPAEPHDKPLDAVVTEDAVYRWRG